ncbi:MAG: DUF4129 domain-containing protein [Ilumatobacter sp.]|uniref:DUF4129 domain-containing protein n=1 Tax=Ilumatobacter sp. TaxID=1967498 RepID=UPI003298AC7F
MSRHRAWSVIAAVLVGVLFAAVATSGGVDLWREPTWDPSLPERDPIEIEVPERPDETLPLEQSEVEPVELPGWVEAIVRVVAMGVVLAGAVALVAWAVQRRPRFSVRGRRRQQADFDVLPDIAAAIIDEAESRRAALLTGAPRNAIVRCWLQLERDVADAGLVRDPSDTSADFTERVLSRYTVDSDAIHRLGNLYREARFSQHELGEASRDAAVDALDGLHRALASRRSRDQTDDDSSARDGAVR